MSRLAAAAAFTGTKLAEIEHPTAALVGAHQLQRWWRRISCDARPWRRAERTHTHVGWNTARLSEPGDVQAVNRMLCDELEQKMEGTCVEGALTALFRGETETSVECTDVPYATTKREYFMDLQLDVKGCRDVAASFAKYVEEERLEGDNQFYLHGFGLQNGKKGTRFLHFPPVLQLELKRFEYDFMRDKMGKICDRYEFSEELDLNRFLHVPPVAPGEPPPPPPDARYLLHSVVVHSGDASRAHNYMFVRPNVVTGGSSNGDYWLRFTEDRVTRVERVEAVEGNFGVGGGDQDSGNNGLNNESLWTAARRRSSARVLVYVRAADVDKVMCAVTESDFPEHVRERERLEVPRSPVQAAAAASLAAQRPLADDHAANDASTPQRRAATQRPAASIPASAPAAAAVAAALAATLLAAQHPSLADDHAADDASSTPQRSAAPLHSAAPTPESAPAAAAAAAVAVTARAAAHDAAAHSSAGARVRGAAARKSGGAEPLSPAAAAEAAVRADAAAAALLAEEDAATAAREADALKRAARNAKKKDKRRSAAAAAAEEAAAALPAAALQTMRDDAPLPLPAQHTLAASAHAPAPPYDPPHQASSSVPPAASVPPLPTLATAPAAPSPPLGISPPASLVGQQLQPQEQQPPPPPTRSAVHPLWDVSMQPRAPSPPPPPLPSAPAAASVAAPGADELALQLAALKAERTCVVCLDAPRVLLLLPCRHLALCGAPACAAMLGAPPRCPLCRVTIVDMFSVFT